MRAKLFRSLRVRNFRLYVTGQLIKLIGVWMLFVAQDWLVLDLSGDSANALGLVTALQFTPVLFLTLYAGQLADRYDKRKLLIVANGVFAVLTIGLAVLVTIGAVRLWQVFVFAAGAGIVQAIETPTRQAFWSELVTGDLLANAVSLGSATFNAARVVGPALAGVGIAWLGTGWLMLVTGILATAPVVLAFAIDPDKLYRHDHTTLTADDTRIMDGLRYVWRHPDIVMVMALVMVIGMMGFNFQLTLAVLAKTVFHTGAEAFGLLTTSLAVGALGASLMAALRRNRPSVYAVLAAALAFAAFETGLGFAHTFWFAVVWAMPTGFFMIYFAQYANQRVQLGVDAMFRGRVMALYVLVFMGTTPLGALVVGWLTDRYGPSAGLFAGGLASFVATLLVGLVQVRRARATVRLHIRPRPHVHVNEPARDGRPAVELRLPALPVTVR